MKLWLYALGIPVLFFASCKTQQTQHISMHENSLLWKITSPNLEKESYLFGTVHYICKDQFFLKEKVQYALQHTDSLFLEMNLADPNINAYSMEFMLTDVSLKEQISEEDYQYLDSLFLNDITMPLSLVDNIKPLFITSIYMNQAFPCEKVSVEEVLINHVQNNAIVSGLSSIEEQFSFGDEAITYDELVTQFKMMKEMDFSLVMDEMFEAYKEENLTKIEELVIEMEKDSKNVSEILLKERNTLWVDKIHSLYMKDPSKKYFFAVGAAHLNGKDGLISLLQEKGYTISPVL